MPGASSRPQPLRLSSRRLAGIALRVGTALLVSGAIGCRAHRDAMGIEVSVAGGAEAEGFVWVSGCGGMSIVPIHGEATEGRVGLDRDCGSDVLFVASFQAGLGRLHTCALNDFYSTPGLERHTVYIEVVQEACWGAVLSEADRRQARIRAPAWATH